MGMSIAEFVIRFAPPGSRVEFIASGIGKKADSRTVVPGHLSNSDVPRSYFLFIQQQVHKWYGAYGWYNTRFNHLKPELFGRVFGHMSVVLFGRTAGCLPVLYEDTVPGSSKSRRQSSRR